VNWAKVSSAAIAVAVALVIIANAPPVLTGPLAIAIAQIRSNIVKTEKSVQPSGNAEIASPVETSEQKSSN